MSRPKRLANNRIMRENDPIFNEWRKRFCVAHHLDADLSARIRANGKEGRKRKKPTWKMHFAIVQYGERRVTGCMRAVHTLSVWVCVCRGCHCVEPKISQVERNMAVCD